MSQTRQLKNKEVFKPHLPKTVPSTYLPTYLTTYLPTYKDLSHLNRLSEKALKEDIIIVHAPIRWKTSTKKSSR